MCSSYFGQTALLLSASLNLVDNSFDGESYVYSNLTSTSTQYNPKMQPNIASCNFYSISSSSPSSTRFVDCVVEICPGAEVTIGSCNNQYVTAVANSVSGGCTGDQVLAQYYLSTISVLAQY